MKSKELLKKLTFTVIDLETTGGNHQRDQIIEVGLVRIEKLTIVDKLTYLVKPDIEIPEFIQKLTSLNSQKLADAPKIEEVISQILLFIGDSILVAHNSSFDVPFFDSVLKRLGIQELTNKSVCTDMMTKNLLPNIINSNLSYMCKLFNIKHTKAHRALEDARVTAKLFLQYLEVYAQRNFSKINQLYYPKNKFEFDTLGLIAKNFCYEKFEKRASKIKTQMLLTFKGEKGRLICSLPIQNFSNEAIEIKDLFRQHHWNSVTIKLFGSYFEALNIWISQYPKLDRESRKESRDYILKNHFLEHGRLKIDKERSADKKWDFIITRHLIPEQFVIYPYSKVHGSGKELIFRYPGHEKKLWQYLVKQNQNEYKKKGKKNIANPPQIHNELQSFLSDYTQNLGTLENQKDNQAILIENEVALSSPKRLKKILKDFSQNSSKNVFNYPVDHI